MSRGHLFLRPEDEKLWIKQTVKRIQVDYDVPLGLDITSDGVRFELNGKYLGPRFSKVKLGINGAVLFLEGLVSGLEAVRPRDKGLDYRYTTFHPTHKKR